MSKYRHATRLLNPRLLVKVTTRFARLIPFFIITYFRPILSPAAHGTTTLILVLVIGVLNFILPTLDAPGRVVLVFGPEWRVRVAASVVHVTIVRLILPEKTEIALSEIGSGRLFLVSEHRLVPDDGRGDEDKGDQGEE